MVLMWMILVSPKHPQTGCEAAPRASPLCFHPFFSFHQEHSVPGEAFRALLGLCCRQGRWEEPQLKGDPRAPFSFLGFQPFFRGSTACEQQVDRSGSAHRWPRGDFSAHFHNFCPIPSPEVGKPKTFPLPERPFRSGATE